MAVIIINGVSHTLGGVKLKKAGPDGKKMRSHARTLYGNDLLCVSHE